MVKPCPPKSSALMLALLRHFWKLKNVIIKMGRKKEKKSKNKKIKLRVKLNHLEDGTVATVESATRVLRSNKSSSNSFKSLKDGSKKRKRKRNQKQLQIHDDRDQEHYDNEFEEEEPLTLIPFCKWNEETREFSEVVTAEELFPLNFEKPTRPIVGFSIFDVQKLTYLPSPENFKIKELIKDVKSRNSRKVNIAKTKRSKAGRSKVEVKGPKGSAVPKAKAQLVSQGEVSSRGRPIKRTFNYVTDANDSEELAPNDEDYIDSDQSTVVSEEELDE